MRSHALAVLTAALAAATILPPSLSLAQPRVRFGVSAGVTPTSDRGWNRAYSGGTNAQLSVELE